MLSASIWGCGRPFFCFQDAKNNWPKAFSQKINSFVVLSKIWVGLKVGDTGSAPKILNNSEHDGKPMA